MTDNNFNFCPKCGKTHVELKRGIHWLCPDCGFSLYNNIAGAVGVIIRDSQGRVLFEVRQKEPQKGFLALPGGFIAPGESAEESAYRECLEELGLKICNLSYLCSFSNNYPYKGVLYKTIDIFFTAKIDDPEPKEAIKRIKQQRSEVAGLELCKCAESNDIEPLPLAFDSARKALEVLCKSGIK